MMRVLETITLLTLYPVILLNDIGQACDDPLTDYRQLRRDYWRNIRNLITHSKQAKWE